MDIDDELLGLAAGGSSKRSGKSKSSKSAAGSKGGAGAKRKRPQAQEDSASDMDMSTDDDDDAPPSRKVKRGATTSKTFAESDDDEEDATESYPLEGKYKDEADRRSILAMNELDREALLGERASAIAEAQSRQQLREMVKSKDRAARGGGSDYEDSDDDGGFKRDRKATGSTNEKRAGFEKLKKSREEKGKKKDRKYDDDEPSSPPSRRRRDSPDDYTDDSDDERDRHVSSSKKKSTADVIGPSDMKDMIVTRSKLAQFVAAPWFEEWVKHAWVRYLVGYDHGEQQYRLCRVEAVKDVPDETYKVGNTSTTLQLELRHAESVRVFKMDAVSDSPFTEREFARLAQTCVVKKVGMPSTKEAQKVKTQLEKRKEYIMTEADVAALLERKGGRINSAAGKARLMIQRGFAIQTNDQKLLDEVNAELAKLEAPASPGASDTEQERMRRVNERNRATNRAEIKKAEGRAQDERRRQAAALARGDSDVKVDPSARVKTMTRLTYDRSDTPSRPSTPSGTKTPTTAAVIEEQQAAADKGKAKGSKFEELVASRVQVDVDLDF